MASESNPSQNQPITIRGFNPPPHQDSSPASVATAIHDPNGRDIQRPRRRSSFTDRLSSLGDVGGVNSFNNFARSWQRAAGFFEVTPTRRPFSIRSDEHGDEEGRTESESRLHHQRSLLRVALEHDAQSMRRDPSEDSEAVIDDRSSGASSLQPSSEDVKKRLSERRSVQFEESIFRIEPSLASPFSDTYGASYGTLSSRIHDSSPTRHAGRLFNQQQIAGTSLPDQDREPLLVKQVEPEEGKIINVVVGQSTLPQTVFNSCNVLLGVGILALPLAMRYSGWVIGMIFFLAIAVITAYTARLLAKCLDVDDSLITFGDLAYVSFGSKARVVVSLLFTLELLASCVALVIIFADSLDALIPGWSTTDFKIACGVIIVPLVFVPLRLLSFTSIMGILSCFVIVLAIFIDGIVKDHAFGSLREPAKTYPFPANWNTLPMAFGLLMAPWGGHSIFPNIYRDMRHPKKYPKAVKITYVFTGILEAALAIAGYLMFGEGTRDEITANIFKTEGYPRWISILMLVAIAIIPITKLPLNARPIISTLEVFCGLDARAMAGVSSLSGMSGLARGFAKIGVRVFTIVMFILVAIAIPAFDRVMALLGSAACFAVCVILPCSFHLKIFGKELPLQQRIFDWFLIIACSILAVVGTVYSILPKEVLGVK